MKKVFVSGCFDILHGGHIEFFTQAKSLGDYLIVSFANQEVLLKHKNRKSSIPDEHKKRLMEAISVIDEVVIGDSLDREGLDFIEHFNRLKPDILVATEDDKYKDDKTKLCENSPWNPKYVVLEKTLNFNKISTSEIINWIKAPKEVPLRVDFAGGWLDVPKFSIAGASIVNCSISPTVSIGKWGYNIGGGLGGSAAYAILNGKNGVTSELDLGVGWQDPAVIKETGLCVWRSGMKPVLEVKYNPDWLKGLMAIKWNGNPHKTYEFVDNKRDFEKIRQAANIAKAACSLKNIEMLMHAVRMSYDVQLEEGMDKIYYDDNTCAVKYCGGGFGGYVLYLFNSHDARELFVETNGAIRIEPYLGEIN
jgi:cytidyltransferase-like protein